MAIRKTAPNTPQRTARLQPRSALRTAKTAQELMGMRSIRRWGLDKWEGLAETQRIAMARVRRLFPRHPRDVAGKAEGSEARER